MKIESIKTILYKFRLLASLNNDKKSFFNLGLNPSLLDPLVPELLNLLSAFKSNIDKKSFENLSVFLFEHKHLYRKYTLIMIIN